MKSLVFVHGRSQQNKDAQALKEEWIDAWRSGLRKSGLAIPLDDSAIRFPYYGDTLAQLADGLDERDAAAVVVKGPGGDDPLDSDEREFIRTTLVEIGERRGVGAEQFAGGLSSLRSDPCSSGCDVSRAETAQAVAAVSISWRDAPRHRMHYSSTLTRQASSRPPLPCVEDYNPSMYEHKTAESDSQII
jgi:hypothetical protein